MTLWRCDNCGETWGQDFQFCPKCGDITLIKGVVCECCEKEWAEEDICENCIDDFGIAIDAFMQYKRVDFDVAVKVADKWVSRHW